MKDLHPVVDANPDAAGGIWVAPRDIAHDRLNVTGGSLCPDYLALHWAIRDFISSFEISRPSSMSRSAS